MAWSGKRATAAAALAALALVGCGDGATSGADAPGTAAGAVRTATLAMDTKGPALPMETSAGVAQVPVAAIGESVVVAVGGEDGAPQAFERWDPRTGARAPLWQGAAGKQDIVLASSGDWLATVRTGLALPFPEWQLILRNVTTGEARTIARNEGTVADAPDLQPGLPFGFAPKPVMDGATVTWIQYAGSAESPVRELRAYDLASGSVTTLDTVALAEGDLDTAAAGGGRTAWLRVDAAGQRFVLREADGGQRELPVEGAPFAAALDASGRHLAWDDGLIAKRVLDIETGATSTFATDEGWGMTAAGSRFTWAPAAAYGGAPGYFDAATGVTHILEAREGVRSNYAALLGPWFVWQSAGPRGDGLYHFTWPGQS